MTVHPKLAKFLAQCHRRNVKRFGIQFTPTIKVEMKRKYIMILHGVQPVYAICSTGNVYPIVNHRRLKVAVGTLTSGIKQNTTQYAHEWARRKRVELISKMGGKCVQCRRVDNLQFDHIYGRDWEPRKLARHNRIVRYRKDWEAGNLQLLCETCNKKKGKPQ